MCDKEDKQKDNKVEEYIARCHQGVKNTSLFKPREYNSALWRIR